MGYNRSNWLGGGEMIADKNTEHQVSKLASEVKSKEDFMFFLHFCVERLNKDEPVQAIWSEYQAANPSK